MAKYQATYRAGAHVPDATIDAMKARMKAKDMSFSDLVNELWEENGRLKDGDAAQCATVASEPTAGTPASLSLENKLDDMKAELLEALRQVANAPTTPSASPVAPTASINACTPEQANRLAREIVAEITAAKEAEIAKLDHMMQLLEDRMAAYDLTGVEVVSSAPVIVGGAPLTSEVVRAFETEAESEVQPVAHVDSAVAVSTDSDLTVESEKVVELDDFVEEDLVDEDQYDDLPSNLTDEEADDIASLLADEIWGEVTNDVEVKYEEEELAFSDGENDFASFITEDDELAKGAEHSYDRSSDVDNGAAEIDASLDTAADDGEDDEDIVFSDDEIDNDVLLGLEAILDL